jgi:hypothetical protein
VLPGVFLTSTALGEDVNMTKRDFEKDRKNRISKTRGAEYVYSNFDGCLPPSNKQTAKKKLGERQRETK